MRSGRPLSLARNQERNKSNRIGRYRGRLGVKSLKSVNGFVYHHLSKIIEFIRHFWRLIRSKPLTHFVVGQSCRDTGKCFCSHVAMPPPLKMSVRFPTHEPTE